MTDRLDRVILTFLNLKYSGGTTKAILLESSGTSFADQTQHVISFPGSGPNKERQEKSHPHMTIEHPTQKTFFIPDLGSEFTLLSISLKENLMSFSVSRRDS
jgi:6-phosphogluconolactonase (cycloisomerase 2 family)